MKETDRHRETERESARAHEQERDRESARARERERGKERKRERERERERELPILHSRGSEGSVSRLGVRVQGLGIGFRDEGSGFGKTYKAYT